jgi:hypothetical protein
MVNHFGAGPRISCQSQGVHRSAKHQPEHAAAVAQAVKTAWLTHIANLEIFELTSFKLSYFGVV